jgi:hypothetical protein
MNALEADVETALGVPDAALAARVQAGATKTALDAAYATNAEMANKEPAIPTGSVTEFLRGDKQWATIDVSGGGGNIDPHPPENLLDATNVWAPAGTKLVVPTHVTPTGGEVTHPSVVFVPEGWNGYKYWMAITPYPAGNDDHEDPNVVASHDGITWVVPNGLTNPIADATGQPQYHSDTDLVLGPNNTMYLFWRWSNSVDNGGTEERLKYAVSTNGVNWSAPTDYWVTDQDIQRIMSPSMIYEDGAWTMYGVDIVPSPNQVVRVRNTSPDPAVGWGASEVLNVGTMQTGKEPWHVQVIKTGGRYYGLLNDCTLNQNGASGDLLFLSSADGITFTNSGVPIVPKVVTGEHDNIYRSCMIPATQGGHAGFRLWYTGWRNTGPVWNLYYTFISAGRWKALTLQNAWVPYTGGGGYNTSGLRYKREGRMVTLEGTVKSGALSTVIATLPTEAVPEYTNMYPVNANGTLGMVRIDGKQGTPGAVTYFAGGAAPAYMPIHIKFELD